MLHVSNYTEFKRTGTVAGTRSRLRDVPHCNVKAISGTITYCAVSWLSEMVAPYRTVTDWNVLVL
jgi:hypothetical protein